MPRTEFHRLTVARVDPLTDDSAAVTFDVPPGLAERFAFTPGQSLTVRRGEERRSYSICAARGGAPRIGVREVAGGVVSGWLVHEVRAGDVIEVQVPSGSFTPDLDVPGHHVLIAAGSGITPVLSIAASVLAAQDKSSVTLLYGNRRNDSVMFADEIADLKDGYPERICLVHVLSREPQEVELFNGRLDAAKLRALLPVTVDVAAVDHWWLCGSTAAAAPLPSRTAPRCWTAPSGSARTCRSPARAGCAAPAAPGWSTARSPCAATTPWSRMSSTRVTFSPASPCPSPTRSPSTTTPSRKEPAMPDLTSPGGDLDPIERASADELRVLQLERLRWTLRHAYASVPHYRAAFDAAGVHPDDCKDLSDLAKYPLTSKAD